ncbi:MAG: hypothetical protein QOJ89_2691 [bacterium]
MPSVVAEVRDARVAALRVYSHGCEYRERGCRQRPFGVNEKSFSPAVVSGANER